jgi:hypothetical protein
MGEQRRVTCILGTRPEAIKLAPVILALKGRSGIECRVCVTGQHRKMLDQVLPWINLLAGLFSICFIYDLLLLVLYRNLSPWRQVINVAQTLIRPIGWKAPVTG